MLKYFLICHLEYGICDQIDVKITALVSQHMVNKLPRNTTCIEQAKRDQPILMYTIQYFTQDDFIYLSMKIITKYVRARLFTSVMKNGLGIIYLISMALEIIYIF